MPRGEPATARAAVGGWTPRRSPAFRPHDGAYFVAACLWLVDGLRNHDKTIWVACIGWVLLDGAVVAGVLLRHRCRHREASRHSFPAA